MINPSMIQHKLYCAAREAQQEKILANERQARAVYTLRARADKRNDLTERLCMAHMSCPGAGALTPNVIDNIRKLAMYIEESHERSSDDEV